MAAIARDKLGIADLTASQREVLDHITQGRDTLAVLPTGSGKTACYVLPALATGRMTLVVSPLISLIRDQVRSLRQQGIAACLFDSLQSRDERDTSYNEIVSGDTRVLYVSPERLGRKRFQEISATLPIGLIAIDEAHCVSLWGSNFRPDYRHLGNYLSHLPKACPRLAVTATATERTQWDIIETLGLRSPAVVWSDWRRPNLKMDIVRSSNVGSQLSSILSLAHDVRGQGIVYTSTRTKANEVFQMLNNDGQSVELYHAGLMSQERERVQNAFLGGDCRIVVATSAFGMGINLPSIRFVFHYGLPSTPEQYVQEIGRAGRDGKDARCVMFYGPKDFYIQKFMMDLTLPDQADLERAFVKVSEQLRFARHCSTPALKKELDSMFPDRAEVLLESLIREGVIFRLKPEGSHLGADEESICEAGPALGPDFWLNYELRRQDQLAKLRKMRDIAKAGIQPNEALSIYFGGAVRLDRTAELQL